jgi:uncharacterized protein YciI
MIPAHRCRPLAAMLAALSGSAAVGRWVRAPAALAVRAGAAPTATRAASTAAPPPAAPAAVPRYLLTYDYAADNLKDLVVKRAPLRAAHFAHAQAAVARGHLELGGAFGDDAGAPGAALVFRGPPALSRADVLAFARADPYVTGGLVSRFTVREWTVVLDSRGAGGAAQAPKPPPRVGDD